MNTAVIIYAVPIAVLILTVIGAICWSVGILRAKWIWNKVDQECDLEDEREYNLRDIEDILSQLLDRVCPDDEIHILSCGHKVKYSTLKNTNWECPYCYIYQTDVHDMFDFSDVPVRMAA
jgi:hypothetical protein